MTSFLVRYLGQSNISRCFVGPEEPLKKLFWLISLLALALCLINLPAMPQTTFFSDLGSQGNVYNCCTGWTISGSGAFGAGQQYFLALGPEDINNDAYLAWNYNSTGATGIDLFSRDGGQTWTSNGEQTIGAFDILGSPQGTVPEPSSLLLLGTGLVGAFGSLRKKRMQ